MVLVFISIILSHFILSYVLYMLFNSVFQLLTVSRVLRALYCSDVFSNKSWVCILETVGRWMHLTRCRLCLKITDCLLQE